MSASVKTLGEPLSKVEQWAIIRDPAKVTQRIREYNRLGVSCLVFSSPPTGGEVPAYRLLKEKVLSELGAEPSQWLIAPPLWIRERGGERAQQARLRGV